MANDYRIINLEDGRPTADIAINIMKSELTRVKAQNVKVVKLIHGYGSSGVGGVLRTVIRRELERMKKRGLIKTFVPGENFEIFNSDTIKILDSCRSVKDDRDLGRFNNGITMVLL